ncbi:unnamed protein product [Lupinus luteus]|uniref:Transmembrane protein n=1 Tax=Lupinus luteus TaxID=3873 RepID=A0AAV1XPR4_LUPLU
MRKSIVVSTISISVGSSYIIMLLAAISSDYKFRTTAFRTPTLSIDELAPTPELRCHGTSVVMRTVLVITSLVVALCSIFWFLDIIDWFFHVNASYKLEMVCKLCSLVVEEVQL